MVCIFTLIQDDSGCRNGDVQSVYAAAWISALYGYDVSGTQYLQRIAGMAVGGILTGIVFTAITDIRNTNGRCVIFLRNLTFIPPEPDGRFA